MFADSLPLGTIHGIKIRIHWSWLIIFVLLTWSLATGYFPSTFPSWGVTEDWLVAGLASILLFVSVLLHELAHSLVAQSEGLQVSSITLFLFGGVSNLTEEPTSPGNEFRMAFAGPAASIVIGAVCLLLYRAISSPDLVRAIFGYLGLTSLLLAAFNLLPAFPLDGGRVLHSIIWKITGNSVVATRWASTIGQMFGWLFGLAGLVLVFNNDLVDGIWFALIGWMIQSSASAYRHAPETNQLKSLTAGDVMTRAFDSIPPDISLERAVQDYLLRDGQRALPVASDGRLLGILSVGDVQHVPQGQWTLTAVARAMTPADRVESIPSTMLVSDALRLMSEHRRHELPVMDNGRLSGVLSESGVTSYFRLRDQLGLGTSNNGRQLPSQKSA